MDASHIVVAGLTGISLALLVWVEIRSRRNCAQEQAVTAGNSRAKQEPNCVAAGSAKEKQPARKRRRGQIRNSEHQNTGVREPSSG
jgi:hypothetical protein